MTTKDKLESDPNVLWFEQQVTQIRRKKNLSDL